MDVKFISKQTGNTVIQCPELGPKHVIRFTRGTCTTSNKTEIKRLLSDDYARRNTKLAPNQNLEDISNYLDSPDRPDVYTKEYLNEIPFELWEEILKVTTRTDAKFPLVGIAKAAMEGTPIEPAVEALVEGHVPETKDTEPEEPEVEDKDVEIEDVVENEETNEPVTSDGFSVREATEYLKGKDHEEVAGFISEGEDRISLLKIWNDKYPEHAVELP